MLNNSFTTIENNFMWLFKLMTFEFKVIVQGQNAPSYDPLNIKGNRMGHSVKASLWCVTLLINTRFRFFIFWNKQLLSASDVTLRQRASK